ncbi:hypothetical protein [Chryseobacterium sp. YR221]|uniref:hypothetical protein n=1 Tax=Chryseobacterium sp. YR221 TaxID=1500293 RepID=UPI0009D906F0|nr:hypothetical protein [Chryseobacterium sp. YR221]SMC60998.1 hypothetical protein SAMN02787074_2019 [Chryseobacterium sp. YR221]
MNVNAMILFDKVMNHSMERFSALSFVKKQVYIHNTEYLSRKVANITQLYTGCFSNFGWLSKDFRFYKRILQGNLYFGSDINNDDSSVSKIMEYLPEQHTMTENSPLPFHIHFTILPNFCCVSGIIWKDNLERIFICLTECSIPRNMIENSPGSYAYLSELLEEYDSVKHPQLRDWIIGKELSIHKIHSDSKKYWGDSFYSHYLKIKMIGALGDVLFTSKTLKEVAISHNFVKYNNMYRAFNRYGIDLSKISRFAKL